MYPGVLGIEELAKVAWQTVATLSLQAIEVTIEGGLDEVVLVGLGVVGRQLLLEVLADRRLIVAHGQQELVERRLASHQLEGSQAVGLALGRQILGEQDAVEEGIVGPAIAVDQNIGDNPAAARTVPEELGRQAVFVTHTAAEGELGDADAVEDLREVHGMAEAVRQVRHHGGAAQGIRVLDAEPQVVDHGFTAHGEGLRLGVPGADKQPLRLDECLQPTTILRADGEVILDYGRLTIQQEVINRPLLQHLEGLTHVIDELHLRLAIGEIPFIVPVGLIYNVTKFFHFYTVPIRIRIKRGT
ncbi:hypothetical protein D3C71_1051010 [compost metagenome]